MLIETILLSFQNTCFGRENKKINFPLYAQSKANIPVPNPISTKSSQTIGNLLSMKGCFTCFPWYFLYLSSSGCTATAVSPNIVSIRVVATTISSSVKTTTVETSEKGSFDCINE